MTSLVDIDVRRKRFGAHTVLDDVRVSIGAGEIVALVGASGCGKSTLLRLVAGLDIDYDGWVRLNGCPVGHPTPDIRFVFQEPRLFPWLTVARNIAFDQNGGVRDNRRVDALLDEVGLAGLGDRLPKQLSGGQAQRVAIARGLFSNPKLLLLDEPFSAVDAFTRLKLQDLLLGVVRTHGVTALLVTHDIDEAVHLADRVVVLEAEPARVAAQIDIDLARPRNRDAAATAAAISHVRHALQVAHTC
ncbi:ABC transporter ATP-binding protein [soil metagenome]